LLTAPRGLTQPTTSFIGSWRQGIPRTPFLAQRRTFSSHARQAGRIGSISLIFDVITLQLLRCSPRAPPPPTRGLPRQTKTAWLLPDRSLPKANASPGQGPSFFTRSPSVSAVGVSVPPLCAATLVYTPFPVRWQATGLTRHSSPAAPGRGCGVGVPGLEPGTSVLSGLRSNQLS
jgi:hypothetical protein